MKIRNTYLIPIKFRLPLIFGAKIKGSELGTEIWGGAKIKGSELGTENRGERKLKGVNWSPKFEKFEKLCWIKKITYFVVSILNLVSSLKLSFRSIRGTKNKRSIRGAKINGSNFDSRGGGRKLKGANFDGSKVPSNICLLISCSITNG